MDHVIKLHKCKKALVTEGVNNELDYCFQLTIISCNCMRQAEEP